MHTYSVVLMLIEDVVYLNWFEWKIYCIILHIPMNIIMYLHFEAVALCVYSITSLVLLPAEFTAITVMLYVVPFTSPVKL